MDISIQGVNFTVSETLKEFIGKKIQKVEKVSDQVVDAEIVLKVIKPEVANNKEASLKLNIKGGEVFASKVADSFEEAFVLCTEAVEKQLIKIKEKERK